MKWACLVIGGVTGTLARYFFTDAVYEVMGTGFPYGTFLVNVVGCLAIGFLAALSESKFLLGPNARLLLMAGFCGAFTTFSAFMLETVTLMRDGHSLKAFFNVTMSIVAGFLALQAGVWAGELAAKV